MQNRPTRLAAILLATISLGCESKLAVKVSRVPEVLVSTVVANSGGDAASGRIVAALPGAVVSIQSDALPSGATMSIAEVDGARRSVDASAPCSWLGRGVEITTLKADGSPLSAAEMVDDLAIEYYVEEVAARACGPLDAISMLSERVPSGQAPVRDHLPPARLTRTTADGRLTLAMKSRVPNQTLFAASAAPPGFEALHPVAPSGGRFDVSWNAEAKGVELVWEIAAPVEHVSAAPQRAFLEYAASGSALAEPGRTIEIPDPGAGRMLVASALVAGGSYQLRLVTFRDDACRDVTGRRRVVRGGLGADRHVDVVKPRRKRRHSLRVQRNDVLDRARIGHAERRFAVRHDPCRCDHDGSHSCA